jgi:hypothetical protein
MKESQLQVHDFGNHAVGEMFVVQQCVCSAKPHAVGQPFSFFFKSIRI